MMGAICTMGLKLDLSIVLKKKQNVGFKLSKVTSCPNATKIIHNIILKPLINALIKAVVSVKFYHKLHKYAILTKRHQMIIMPKLWCFITMLEEERKNTFWISVFFYDLKCCMVTFNIQ